MTHGVVVADLGGAHRSIERELAVEQHADAIGHRQEPIEIARDHDDGRVRRALLLAEQLEDLLRRDGVEPGRRLVGGLVAFDRHGADAAFVGGGATVGALGTILRRVQNGFVRSYALSVLGGVLLVVLALLVVNFG